MKSFSIRRSQVAKQNRETIVKIADTIYIKRRRWLSSNCERRREDNKRTKPMIIADRYAFSDVWTSGGHDSFVILIFACKIKNSIQTSMAPKIYFSSNKLRMYCIILSKCSGLYIFLPNCYEAEICLQSYWLHFPFVWKYFIKYLDHVSSKNGHSTIAKDNSIIRFS